MENIFLIISGGHVNHHYIKKFLSGQKVSHVICADKGFCLAQTLGISIDYIVGDFDSVAQDKVEAYTKNHSVEVRKFQPEKDFTDTQIAISLALEKGATEIIILGATGTRLDHVFANINLLMLPLSQNVKASIVDEYNKIYLCSRYKQLHKRELHGPYVSLLPLTEQVTGVTLEGFKYPLQNALMKIGDSLGVSNEVINRKAKIKIDKGILVVIESRDEGGI